MRYEEYILLAGLAGTVWLAAWAGILTRLAWRLEGAVAACGGVFAWDARNADANAAAAAGAGWSVPPPGAPAAPVVVAASAENAASLLRLDAAAAAGSSAGLYSYGPGGSLHLGGAWTLAHPFSAGLNCSAVAQAAGLASQSAAVAASGAGAAVDLARRLDEASGRAAIRGSAAASTESLLPAVLLAALIAVAIAPIPDNGLLLKAWPRRASRVFFFRSLVSMLTSPLSRVRLPDFFLADQIVSQPLALSDLLYFGCYYASGAYRDGGGGETAARSAAAGVCLARGSPGALAVPVALGICIAPYWIRILQCLRRLADEGHPKVHLTNIGKYAIGAVAACLRLVAVWHPGAREPGPDEPPLAAVSAYRGAAVAASAVATVYALMWDLRMDWGLWLPRLRRALLLERPWGAQRPQTRAPTDKWSDCFCVLLISRSLPATAHARTSTTNDVDRNPLSHQNGACALFSPSPLHSVLRGDRAQRRRPLPVGSPLCPHLRAQPRHARARAQPDAAHRARGD